MFFPSSKKAARSSIIPSLLVLLALASSTFAASELSVRQSNGTQTSNPDVDPADDLHNPLRYIAKNVYSIIALGELLLSVTYHAGLPAVMLKDPLDSSRCCYRTRRMATIFHLWGLRYAFLADWRMELVPSFLFLK